jgi:transcriptional regulator with XRE-family HTH domain
MAERTNLRASRQVGGGDRAPNGQSNGIGQRIRAYRKMRRLSLKQVASHAGVTESFLSQVEREQSNASVAMLHLIAEGLGLHLADLFAEAAPGRRVLRKVDRPTIVSAGTRKYMLTQRPLRYLEVLYAEIDPGASAGGRTHSHGDSQELLIVISGSVTVTVGEETFDLSEGDSIEYDSSIPHALGNSGTQVAHVMYVISPPSL